MLDFNITANLNELGKILIEKISHAVGVLYDPWGIKRGKRDFIDTMNRDIINDDTLSWTEKAAIINESILLLRKNQNRKNIITNAIPLLNDDADPNAIDDSWILSFLDKSGLVSEEQLQIIWSRVLAGEANRSHTVSKRLLHNLSIMSQKDAFNFVNLSKFCFYDKVVDLVHPLIFIKRYPKLYADWNITTQILNELEEFFLIETNYDDAFIFKNSKKFIYTNCYIEVQGNRIDAGNVRFTEDGQTLFRMIDKLNDNNILEIIVRIWKMLNYRVEINKFNL